MLLALLSSEELTNGGIAFGYVILIALGSYLLASLARVHLGSCYPSDCILSLPVALVVIAAAYGIRALESPLGCN